jgi:hypothetical protein
MSESKPGPRTELPGALRLAIIGVLAFPILLFVHLVIMLHDLWQTNPEALGEASAKPLLVLVGAGFVARGLHARKPWAWWTTVLLGTAWVLGGIWTTLETDGAPEKSPYIGPVILGAALCSLAVAVIALLQRDTRGAFLRRAP